MKASELQKNDIPASLQEPIKLKKKGVPIASLNYILAALVVILTIFLLITTFRINAGYQKLSETIDDYVEWEKDVNKMSLSSDKLTSEVRMFVETGAPQHLRLYFIEAQQTKGRDEALEKIRSVFTEESEIYKALLGAMKESVTLMDHEYLAMVLKLQSMGLDPGDYDPILDQVELTEAQKALTPEEMAALAQELVYDNYYRQKKEAIERDVAACLDKLIDEVGRQESEASETLNLTLIEQRVWITLLLISVAVIVTLTSIQVIRPLHKAVPRIRGDKTLPVEGAAEFRLLASTYNRMYEINQAYQEKLHFRANHDQLTGVLNRAGIEEMLLGADLSKAALLIVDIDYFKQVNDTYGHAAGDAVLAHTSRVLQTLFRTEDIICRMGGDEFAIIMWHVGPEMKELIADKVKRANERLASGEDGITPVTVSVGVAFGGEHSDEIFRRADKALYQVKASGRGSCAFYEEG